MNQTLRGRRILVTRPAAQAGTLAQLITAEGGEPVLFPLLTIAPADDVQPLRQAIARLDDYSIAIFISPNALEFSLPIILAERPWPADLQAAAIGPSTAVQLAACGIGNVIVPAGRFDSEALLALPAFQAGCVAGKNVLILRGNGGREMLAETLIERGAQVDCVTCYQRSSPTDAAPLRSRLQSGQLDALTISSSEGLRNLLNLLDTDDCERLRMLPLFVPHQRIAEVAAERGLLRIVLTRPADAGIIEALCGHDWLGEVCN